MPLKPAWGRTGEIGERHAPCGRHFRFARAAELQRHGAAIDTSPNWAPSRASLAIDEAAALLRLAGLIAVHLTSPAACSQDRRTAISVTHAGDAPAAIDLDREFRTRRRIVRMDIGEAHDLAEAAAISRPR